MKILFQFIHVCSLFCPPSVWTHQYNIVNLKNLIRESARIEWLSAIFLSALLRSGTSENAIKAIEMRSK